MINASFVVLILHFLFHPFHISVMEVLYRPESKSVQVSVRLFLDDLEVALQAETQNRTLDITDETSFDYLNQQIGKYMSKRIKITGKKDIPLTYLGFEYEDDALWCYLEATKVKKFDIIEIENEILIEAFSDQENLIHFRTDGKVESARLSPEKTTATFNLTEM